MVIYLLLLLLKWPATRPKQVKLSVFGGQKANFCYLPDFQAVYHKNW